MRVPAGMHLHIEKTLRHSYWNSLTAFLRILTNGYAPAEIAGCKEAEAVLLALFLWLNS